MQKKIIFDDNRITLRGIAAALIFACSPFMYAIVFGRGLFIYLALFFVGVILLYALSKDGGRIFLHIQMTEILFLCCMAWEIVTYIWSPATNFDSFYSLFKIAVLFLLLSTCDYSQKEKNLMMITVVIVSILAIYSVLTSGAVFSMEGVDAMRVSFSFFGVIQDPNYLCFFFLVPIAFLLSIALEKKNNLIKKIVCWLGMLCLLYGILRTGSRGGLIAALVVIAVYICTFQKQKFKTILLIGIITGGVVLLYDQIMSLLPVAISNRFTLANVMANGASNRSVTWSQYYSAIVNNLTILILGNGNGSGSYCFGFAAHNYLLESWFEYGVVGVILLVAFYRLILKNARVNHNWIAYSALWGTVVLAMTLSVGKNLYFWLTVTLINIISKNERINYGNT